MLAGNCLPYHQLVFLAIKDSKKAGWLYRPLVALDLPLLHCDNVGPTTECGYQILWCSPLMV